MFPSDSRLLHSDSSSPQYINRWRQQLADDGKDRPYSVMVIKTNTLSLDVEESIHFLNLQRPTHIGRCNPKRLYRETELRGKERESLGMHRQFQMKSPTYNMYLSTDMLVLELYQNLLFSISNTISRAFVFFHQIVVQMGARWRDVPLGRGWP